MKERTPGTTLDLRGEKKRYLLPPNYSETIERRADVIQRNARGLLTRTEAGALAIYETLSDRAHRLRKDFDWENRRAGPMVELQWIEEQVERVESSDSIKSARQKLQEKSLADMRSRMDEEGASSSEE